ncbi:hypothetical protein KZ483_24900 [Paenibacillus sp. sptzw28]|uniref:hypothetical protein n=1 Tax=Paenibacillus sp. sptzw28 TaxID=715179 RepID=UPI001C6E6A60|nr:hypothetical protein [Paenibacillus sp. sptzw28]QYR20948.1 hypothetical protein KZ483_24900 [Paenibacillus sp. sptzw28]
MGPETFLLIDPYTIFDKNSSGRCYFDLFVKAVDRGIKTMLWYGFETLEGQKKLHAKMRDSLRNTDRELSGIDFYTQELKAIYQHALYQNKPASLISVEIDLKG